MGVPLAAHREPRGGNQNKPPKVLYVFEHKTEYILTLAPHTRTVAFWHITPKDFLY